MPARIEEIDMELACEYYRDGWSTRSIADDFGVPLNTIATRFKRLIKAGKLQPRGIGYKPIDFARAENVDNHRKAIIKLRKDGRTNDEIATKIGLSVNTIKVMASELVREGLIERRGNNKYSKGAV